METILICVFGYIAFGAACFCHPPSPARPNDFNWRNQIDVFRVTLPEVLCWPVALWRFALADRR